MGDVDIYPVGLLRDIRNRSVRHGLRYLGWRIRARDWRTAKNYFNGYLAEPTPFPTGLNRCGSGWTRRRALRDLNRRMALDTT